MSLRADLVRRRLVLGLGGMLCLPSRAFALGEVLDEAQRIPETLAVASFNSDWSGKTNYWTLILSKDYKARWTAMVNQIGAEYGRLQGEFGLYETEFASASERQRFFGLPARFLTRRPVFHTATYMIGVRQAETGAFHKVAVDFWTAREPTDDLRFFFRVWKRMWHGVPGYPRQGNLYEG